MSESLDLERLREIVAMHAPMPAEIADALPDLIAAAEERDRLLEDDPAYELYELDHLRARDRILAEIEGMAALERFAVDYGPAAHTKVADVLAEARRRVVSEPSRVREAK